MTYEVPLTPLPADEEKRAHLAGDVVDLIAEESIDYAQAKLGMCQKVRPQVIQLATSMVQAKAQVYGNMVLAQAIEHAVADLCSAIEGAELDIGSVIEEGSKALAAALQPPNDAAPA